MDSHLFWILVLLWPVVAFFWYRWGKDDAQRAFEEDAIHAGKAEYYLDESNERKWRWK